MLTSKKSMTAEDSWETIRARDLSIILEMHYSGKSLSMSIMHSKEAGLCDATAKKRAVLPVLSGFRIYKGRVLSVTDSWSFCFSLLYLVWIYSMISELSAK